MAPSRLLQRHGQPDRDALARRRASARDLAQARCQARLRPRRGDLDRDLLQVQARVDRGDAGRGRPRARGVVHRRRVQVRPRPGTAGRVGMTTPVPRTLYVHDDLSAELKAHGAHAQQLGEALFERLRADERIVVLTLDEQLDALVARGQRAPFAAAVGIGRAGARVAAGVAAAGRILEDVSFINASGLVRRGAIRRAGQASLAFFERPEWMEAWFPGYTEAIVKLCRELHEAVEAPRADRAPRTRRGSPAPSARPGSRRPGSSSRRSAPGR